MTLRLGRRVEALTALRMRRAIAAGQLELHCQPTVRCADGEIEGAEALVRWRHRSGALVAPGAWVPAVERSRLRDRFNLAVIELAVAQRAAWEREGLRIPLSVNVTPSSLADERFVAALLERLDASGDALGGLRLEITERTTAINSAALKANAQQLAWRGLELALDDFGVGYSSLARVAHLPVRALKVDGSLVADITEEQRHRAIVQSVVTLAHSLDLRVVGEGVEDAATWAALQGLGCDDVQGYAVARPMPAAQLPAFVRGYRPAPPQAPAAERRWSANRRSGDERRGRRDPRHR